jgi:hypothetical protein
MGEALRKTSLFWTILFFLVLLGGCAATRPSTTPPPREKPQEKTTLKAKTVKARLARMGFTIQTGAFSKVANAARFTETLKAQGLDATYFVAGTGLYKVRFGNYAKREDALSVAQILKSMGVIDDFYVVNPEDYAVAVSWTRGEAYLRDELIKSAKTFIGVPYLWGGTSVEDGFDCSGLTMTVYQLNGLNLPRTSAEQYSAGETIPRRDLKRGDLVFFATTGREKVSHVGIYIGDDRFVHAPRRGKKIRIDSLANGYYAKSFLGGRTYL